MSLPETPGNAVSKVEFKKKGHQKDQPPFTFRTQAAEEGTYLDSSKFFNKEKCNFQELSMDLRSRVHLCGPLSGIDLLRRNFGYADGRVPRPVRHWGAGTRQSRSPFETDKPGKGAITVNRKGKWGTHLGPLAVPGLEKFGELGHRRLAVHKAERLAGGEGVLRNTEGVCNSGKRPP